jgi:GNAT superfamily N-acetyltransferase
MHVRRAVPDDAPALAQLRWDFRAGESSPIEDEGEFVARCSTWMRQRLMPPAGWVAWVAERDGQIVGQVWVQVFEKLPNPGAEPERHAYISNLYVSRSSRGGAGTRLLEACLAWLDTQSVASVLLWPTGPSRSLYRRHGFLDRTTLMERPF